MLKNNKNTSSMESLIGADNSSSDVSSSENSSVCCKPSCQEKLSIAELYKNEGNIYFKQGKTREAIKKYHCSLLYLKGVEADQKKMHSFSPPNSQEIETLNQDSMMKLRKLTADCHNNLAACLLASKDPLYNRVIERCDNSLSLQPDNVKALYRKGVALYYLKKYSESHEVLQKALSLPEGEKNATLKKYYNLVQKAKSGEEDQLKQTCQTIFKSL